MNDIKWPHTLKAGCLAYLDSFAGLVPIKVIKITDKREVAYEVTETVGAYKKGDQDTTSTRYAVPRKAIRTTAKGQFRIQPYNVEVTP